LILRVLILCITPSRPVMAIVIISLGLNQASYLSRLDEEEKLASFIIHSLEHIQTYTHTHKACLLFL
jgi:hypothetical protein